MSQKPFQFALYIEVSIMNKKLFLEDKRSMILAYDED